MKKLLYISFFVFACHFCFGQGVGNGDGANINVGQGGHLVTAGSNSSFNCWGCYWS